MKYLILICAVLVFATLGIVSVSYSQIVYYKFNPAAEVSAPTVGDDQSVTINFQPVGINDSMTFSISTINGPILFASLSYEISTDENFYFAGIGNPEYPFVALNLEIGANISNEINYYDRNGSVYLYSESSMGFTWYDFQNVESGFIGFAYVQNTDTINGWIRINTICPSIFTGGYDAINKIEIIDMAINTEPGGLIHAGEGILPIAENIKAEDVSDFKDERDLKISFSNAINNSGISEHRVYIVPSEISGSFDLTTTESISSGNYFNIIQTDTSFSATVPIGTKDSEGNNIQELISYKIFVLSVGDGVILTENYLSPPSEEIVLTTAVNLVENPLLQSIYNGGDSFNAEISFTFPDYAIGVLQYRILFVKSSEFDEVDLAFLTTVSSENYIIIEPSTGAFTNSYSCETINDINGDALNTTENYKVCIMSVADMVNANLSVFVSPSNELIFYFPCLPVSDLSVYDNSNNGNASDIAVSFTKSDESMISSYRVFVVENEDADSFSNELANITPFGNYHEIATTDADISTNLPTTLKTFDGEIISENVKYRIFVQSVANITTANVNSLSQQSEIFVLHNPDYFKAGQQDGESVTSINYDPYLTLDATKIDYGTEYYLNLYINSDDQADARIVMLKTGAWHGDNIEIDVESLSNSYICVSENDENMADVLIEKQMIGEDNIWCNGSKKMAYDYGGWDGSGPGGLWYNANQKYLALAYFTEVDTVYAWYMISVQSARIVEIESSARQIFSSVKTNKMENISIFPNPAGNYTEIMVPSEFINSEISIYDVRGTKIFSENISNNKTIINTSDLGSGLYFVTINGNESSYSSKLIIR